MNIFNALQKLLDKITPELEYYFWHSEKSDALKFRELLDEYTKSISTGSFYLINKSAKELVLFLEEHPKVL